MHKVTEKTYKPAGRKLPQHVDKLVDETCEDCRFYCKDTKTCDYLLTTDKCRPCPPGKGCTAKEPDIMVKGKRCRWDPVKARELYQQGMSDPAIAREVGTTSYTISWWRKRNNLPANHTHVPGKRDWSREEARRLYDQGMIDKEIAQAVGVTTGAIFKWRRREGLAANGK